MVPYVVKKPSLLVVANSLFGSLGLDKVMKSLSKKKTSDANKALTVIRIIFGQYIVSDRTGSKLSKDKFASYLMGKGISPDIFSIYKLEKDDDAQKFERQNFLDGMEIAKRHMANKPKHNSKTKKVQHGN